MRTLSRSVPFCFLRLVSMRKSLPLHEWNILNLRVKIKKIDGSRRIKDLRPRGHIFMQICTTRRSTKIHSWSQTAFSRKGLLSTVRPNKRIISKFLWGKIHKHNNKKKNNNEPTSILQRLLALYGSNITIPNAIRRVCPVIPYVTNIIQQYRLQTVMSQFKPNWVQIINCNWASHVHAEVV